MRTDAAATRRKVAPARALARLKQGNAQTPLAHLPAPTHAAAPLRGLGAGPDVGGWLHDRRLSSSRNRSLVRPPAAWPPECSGGREVRGHVHPRHARRFSPRQVGVRLRRLEANTSYMQVPADFGTNIRHVCCWQLPASHQKAPCSRRGGPPPRPPWGWAAGPRRPPCATARYRGPAGTW